MPGSEGDKGDPHSTGLVGKAASRFLFPQTVAPLGVLPAVLEDFVPLSDDSQGWSGFSLPPSKNYQGASGIRGLTHPARGPGASLTCSPRRGKEQGEQPAQPHALSNGLAQAAVPCLQCPRWKPGLRAARQRLHAGPGHLQHFNVKFL